MTMIDGKLANLVAALLEKSRASKIPWKATAQENSYLCVFGGFGVSIRQTRIATSTIWYFLSIVNEDGVEIETLSARSNSTDFVDLDEMFTLARRSANKVEEGLDRLLRELRNI